MHACHWIVFAFVGSVHIFEMDDRHAADDRTFHSNLYPIHRTLPILVYCMRLALCALFTTSFTPFALETILHQPNRALFRSEEKKNQRQQKKNNKFIDTFMDLCTCFGPMNELFRKEKRRKSKKKKTK